MGIFEKNRKKKWEYLPKNKKIIITSFTQDRTIVKVYLAILDVFKINSLHCNYAAI